MMAATTWSHVTMPSPAIQSIQFEQDQSSAIEIAEMWERCLIKMSSK